MTAASEKTLPPSHGTHTIFPQVLYFKGIYF